MLKLNFSAALLEMQQNISLSVPLIASWLMYAMTGFIGTVMVAHLGTNALAASILVGSIWSLLTVFFFGIFNAVSVLVSHQYGMRQYGEIGKIIMQAFFIAIGMCVPILSIIMLLPLFLHTLFGPSPVLTMATHYAMSLVWATPAVTVLLILENFLNGIGKTKMSLWISLIEVPFEILLVYAFVFGKAGLPAFGIAGVGYGLTASYAITTIALIVYLCRAKFAAKYQLFSYLWQFDYAYFKALLSIGIPIGVMYLIEVSAFTTATYMIAHFNTTLLAAHQITMQYLGLTINVAYAIGQAVSIRIGYYAGKNNIAGVIYASIGAMLLSFYLLTIICAVYLLFPHFLISADIDIHTAKHALLVKEATALLAIAGIFQLFDSTRVVAASVLRALKDTTVPMLVSALSFWVVGIGCAFVFAFLFHWQGVGVWLGLTVGVLVGCLCLCYRTWRYLQTVNLTNVLQV